MPMYEWECPTCKGITNVVNTVADYNKPPEKCDPSPIRTDEKKSNGEPIYQKIESCGHTGTEVETDLPDGTVSPGWKKLIGSTRFILRGYGWARDGYR